MFELFKYKEFTNIQNLQYNCYLAYLKFVYLLNNLFFILEIDCKNKNTT